MVRPVVPAPVSPNARFSSTSSPAHSSDDGELVQDRVPFPRREPAASGVVDAAGARVRRVSGVVASIIGWRPPRRVIIAAVAVGTLLVVALVLLGSGVTDRQVSARVDERLPMTSGADISSAPIGGSAPQTVVPTSGPLPTAGPLPGAGAEQAVSAGLVVHAAGALLNPGVYVMAPGSRLADLVAAAGGLAGDADGDVINLASLLRDGQRWYVPHRGRPVPTVLGGLDGGGSSPLSGTTDAAGGVVAAPTAPVDLNTATAAQLDALPGVGPATAAAIIEHRTRIGSFRSVTQLLDVPGIGEAKLAALRQRVSTGQT